MNYFNFNAAPEFPKNLRSSILKLSTVSEGDLGHCDKLFSFNLIFYLAAKNSLF
jgi:hypothetical protein